MLTPRHPARSIPFAIILATVAALAVSSSAEAGGPTYVPPGLAPPSGVKPPSMVFPAPKAAPIPMKKTVGKPSAAITSPQFSKSNLTANCICGRHHFSNPMTDDHMPLIKGDLGGPHSDWIDYGM